MHPCIHACIHAFMHSCMHARTHACKRTANCTAISATSIPSCICPCRHAMPLGWRRPTSVTYTATSMRRCPRCRVQLSLRSWRQSRGHGHSAARSRGSGRGRGRKCSSDGGGKNSNGTGNANGDDNAGNGKGGGNMLHSKDFGTDTHQPPLWGPLGCEAMPLSPFPFPARWVLLRRGRACHGGEVALDLRGAPQSGLRLFTSHGSETQVLS